MDAVTYLNDHIDMLKLLEHYDFDRVKPQGSMIRACCKLHGGNNSTGFAVNTSNNLWYCHTGGCGGGDAYELVKRIEKVSFPESVQIVARIMGVDIENLEIIEQKASYMDDMKKWIRTMRARTEKKATQSYQIDAVLRDVAKFRDFHPETLEHFGLKYAEKITLINKEGKPYTLYHRLVFPIIQQNDVIGVSIRRIKAQDMPKWSHQPAQLETKEILYNFDAAQGLSTIVIVEGIPDVWAYHEIGITAVCTFGAHLTEEQYRLLMRTGADLIWSYDGDKAGRIAFAKAVTGYTNKEGKFIQGMFHLKANNYVVHFEDGEDPASISREELKQRYAEKQRCL
jgi:DNA primase